MANPQHIAIKNFHNYQHYKDRKPGWIKLYVDILTDDTFTNLNETDRLLYLLLLCVAANRDNRIPNEPAWIAHETGLSRAKIRAGLRRLTENGLVLDAKHAETEQIVWPSRYVSRAKRDMILRRDAHKCVQCGATNYLEVDHIIPVSRWNEEHRQGNVDAESNLQTLCRSCNRKKRVSVTKSEDLRSNLATHKEAHLRSPREREEDINPPYSPPHHGPTGTPADSSHPTNPTTPVACAQTPDPWAYVPPPAFTRTPRGHLDYDKTCECGLRCRTMLDLWNHIGREHRDEQEWSPWMREEHRRRLEHEAAA